MDSKICMWKTGKMTTWFFTFNDKLMSRTFFLKTSKIPEKRKPEFDIPPTSFSLQITLNLTKKKKKKLLKYFNNIDLII